MRIALIVLMVLGILATAGIGLLASTNGYGSDAEEAAQLVTQLEKTLGADNAKVAELKTVVSGYKTSATGGLLLVVLSLGLAVTTFAKKAKPQLVMVLGTIALAVLFIALSPSFETGPLGKADARTQAMMYGIPGILAALFAFGAEKIRQKRLAA